MKKRILSVLGMVMIMGCLSACAKSTAASASAGATAASEDAAAEYETYEFETYDGDKVVIDASNIVSQETVEEALEWSDLPADAEQMAPGRDFILFADADNYYVEDAVLNLVTVAAKKQ